MFIHPYRSFFILLGVLITTRLFAVLPNDTIKTTASTPSSNTFKSKVEYKATDSIRFDIVNQKVYLFGSADVKYEEINLQANYIEIDLKNNTVSAQGSKDSIGKDIGLPVFKEGVQEFTAQQMKYNFETKKGKITDVITHEGDGYIHGETVKKDTGNVIFIKSGKYTTCNLEHPHFYIGANKLKIIQNDKIITGPAYLVVADVPTPLIVPFGFFPNKKGQSSGIIIPTYGEDRGSRQLGFFLSDGGYYFGINDKVDLTLKGDIYSRGTWVAKASSNYKVRYKYNGNLNVRYANRVEGVKETPLFVKQSDFFINWSHVQDAKANPGSVFSAQVNAGSSRFNQRYSFSGTDRLTNTYNSNVSYSKSWSGTPFNLTASARHSQNVIQKTIDVWLPDIAFTINRIYPFKKKTSTGNNWYDKIAIGLTSNATNSISTYDSLLFTDQSLEKLKNGIMHTVPLNLPSFDILKKVNVVPTMNFTSKWYFKTIDKRYIGGAADTLITDTVNGLKTANEFGLGVAFNTRLYGMYQFRGKRLKAIRHVMTPNITFSYRPDFSETKYGYYKTVQTDLLGKTEKYSIFQNGVYGVPGAGKSALILFGLNNNVEMKLKSTNDTASSDTKVSLIDRFSINSGYNLAADSLRLSPFVLAGQTKLFKKIDVNVSTVVNPYNYDNFGRPINELMWQKNKTLGRLTSASLAVGTSLRSKENVVEEKQSNNTTKDEIDFINSHPEAFIDFNVPWTLNISYNLNYTKPTTTKTINQTFAFNGDFSLTPNWKVGFNSGYDFVNKKISYTSVNVYRDLHCWEMTFNWIPIGVYQSYNLSIKVKSAVLQDLKLTRKSVQVFQ